MDYSQALLEVVNSQAEVLFANYTLNNNAEYIEEIDSTTEHFTKELESYKQMMADNQHNYEKEMDEMEEKYHDLSDEQHKNLLKTINEKFSHYEVLNR